MTLTLLQLGNKIYYFSVTTSLFKVVSSSTISSSLPSLNTIIIKCSSIWGLEPTTFWWCAGFSTTTTKVNNQGVHGEGQGGPWRSQSKVMYQFISLNRHLGVHRGKGKTIAGVSSQFYHRSFIIAVLSSRLYHRGFIIEVLSSQLYLHGFLLLLGTIQIIFDMC